MGTSSAEFSDIFLADGAVINLGNSQDVTLTHIKDTGIKLNGPSELQFGDSGTKISQSADGVLDLESDDEVEINGTTIDINGAVDISGALLLVLRLRLQDHCYQHRQMVRDWVLLPQNFQMSFLRMVRRLILAITKR